MTEMDQKSRVLVLGATGYIGKYIAQASARLGHPTFVLVRPASVEGPLNSSKKELLDSFTAAGITILHVCTPSIINNFFLFRYTPGLSFIFLRNFF
jgi:NAD(P)-dependent dehydrogenase (short-subunit alcohol dehydrogenase family)